MKRLVMRMLKNRTTFFTKEHMDKALESQNDGRHIELIQKINLKRCYYDEMYDSDGTHYLKVGLSAIDCIEDAISQSEVNVIEHILDLPCGYGRVMRFLKASFPTASLTACDLNKHAVDFCEKEFGAMPAYSNVNLDKFTIGKKFDLIWCGSLVTHLDATNTKKTFAFFHRHLNIGGVLIFSMHGEKMLENLSSKKFSYALSDASVKKIISEFEQQGYGYANYKHKNGYGISLAKEEWIKDELHKAGNWRNYRLAKTAWDNHHDIYSIVKSK